MRTSMFRTVGMRCPQCPLVVEWTVEELPGVTCVHSDLDAGITVVEYDPEYVSSDDVSAAIDSTGYSAELIAEEAGIPCSGDS